MSANKTVTPEDRIAQIESHVANYVHRVEIEKDMRKASLAKIYLKNAIERAKAAA